jgi:outer membrane murein-binding lipoprotein Lpp
MSGKLVDQWTDARLNDLASALRPLPSQVASLTAAVEHLGRVSAELEPVPSEVAVLVATVERLSEENRSLRQEVAAMQRNILQIGWGLVAALVGAAAALITALP